MYLAALVTGLCLSYVVLSYGLPWFFEGRRARLSPNALRSILVIALSASIAFFVSFQIEDIQLANRALHMLGGGFVAFLACVLAARDTGLTIGRLRFFIVATLLVTFMGVANELVEFVLDTYTSLLFSSSRIDTWLDLASNVLGILIAAVCLLSFVPASSGFRQGEPRRS